MLYQKIILLLLSFILITGVPLQAANVCGRTATINYQEHLVDSGNTKGQGLRLYLQKDPEALKLLDEYQNKSTFQWTTAIAGTIGTGLLIAGIASPGPLLESAQKTKRGLLISGLAILLINYLAVRTIDYNNEGILLRSIEEYNKRNLPRIYFNPFKDGQGREDVGFSTGIIKEF